MDAIVFDFDGVVVDSEPIHLKCFQQVLNSVGVDLSDDKYYDEYLGFDDHDCLAAALTAAGMRFTEPLLAELTERKTELVQREYGRSIEPLPGAVELIRSAAEGGIPLAVCSGALRKEIELAARTIGALEHFVGVVAAEDVSAGKPDPEGYTLALRLIGERLDRDLSPGRCAAVEDSPAGIEAAVGAGLHVLAVTNSYPADALQSAGRVVDSLEEITPADLARLIGSGY